MIKDEFIEFDWYFKPSFSGRFFNFLSQHPICRKRGIIYCLVDKVFKLSHPKFLQKNLDSIIKLLLNNDYLLEFIFSNIRNRIKYLIQTNKFSVPVSSCSKQPSFFTVAYINNIVERFIPLAKNLDKSIAYTVTNKLNRIIKNQKDPLPAQKLSNVVYKINCGDCDASYVGQTGRQLNTRIKEHRQNINRPSSSISVEHRLKGHEYFISFYLLAWK